MEENTQLPKEVVSEIKTKASFHSGHKPDEDSTPFRNGYYSGYMSGAIAYAAKLHQANEVIKVLEYDNNKLKGQVEGLQDAVEELKGAGAIWIKSTDRVPDHQKYVHCRSGLDLLILFYDCGGKAFFNEDGDEYLIDEIEWLDESAAGREDAVEFGQWLREQRADVFYGSPSTTKLYELFKQQKEK